MSQNKKRINLPAYNIGGLFDKAKETLSGLGDTYENLLDEGEKAAESQGGKIARDVGMGLFDTTIGMGLTPFGYQGGNYQTEVGQGFKKGFSTAADINQLGAAFIPGASQIQQASSGLFEQAVPGSTTGDSFITPEMQQGLSAATSLGSMMGTSMTSGGMNNTTDTTNTLQTGIPQNNLGTFGQGVGTFGTASLRAYGGKMPKYDNGGNLIKYENGGTHEQNPMGGVPVDSQGNLASITGQPPVGLVEGGETAFTNNIGETTINSDRITLTKELFNTLKEKAPGVFKKNDVGKSFADITKRIEKDYELRVDDEIAHKEKENKLEQVAEISQILAEQKAQEEQMAQQQDMPQQTTIPQQPMQQGMPMAKHGGNILHSQYHNMSQEDYDKATATYPGGGKLKERAEIPPINYTMPGPEGYAIGGKINIKPENKGKFTAKAKAAGMGVQSFANKVLKAKEGTYSPSTRKQANFARNASKWNKANGGELSKDPPINIKNLLKSEGISQEDYNKYKSDIDQIYKEIKKEGKYNPGILDSFKINIAGKKYPNIPSLIEKLDSFTYDNGGELNKDSITEFKPYTEIDGIPVEKVFTEGDYGDYDLIAEDGEVITSGYAPPPKKIENEVAGEWRNKIKPPVWEKMDPMSRVEKIKNQNLNKNIKGPISLNRNIPIPNFKGSYTRYGNPNIPMGYVNNEGRRDTINDERMWNILNNRANGGNLPQYAGGTEGPLGTDPTKATLTPQQFETSAAAKQFILDWQTANPNTAGLDITQLQQLPEYDRYINALQTEAAHKTNIGATQSNLQADLAGQVERGVGDVAAFRQQGVEKLHRTGITGVNKEGAEYSVKRGVGLDALSLANLEGMRTTATPKQLQAINAAIQKKQGISTVKGAGAGFAYGGKLPKYSNGGEYNDPNIMNLTDRGVDPAQYTTASSFNMPLHKDIWNYGKFQGYIPPINDPVYYTEDGEPLSQASQISNEQLLKDAEDFNRKYNRARYGHTGTTSHLLEKGDMGTLNYEDPGLPFEFKKAKATLDDSDYQEYLKRQLNKRKGLTDTQKDNIGKGFHYASLALGPGSNILEGLFAKRDYSQRQINPQYADAIDRMTKAETLYDKYAQAPDISQQLADIRRAELAGLQTTRDVSGGRGSAVASGSLATRLASERRRSALRERAEEIGTQRKLGAQQFRAGLAGQMASLGERERAEDIRAEQERIMADAQARNIRRAGMSQLADMGQGLYRDKESREFAEKYGLNAKEYALIKEFNKLTKE